MNKCLNCGAEIIQKNGGKQRLFCDNQNKCKQAYHNKTKKEPKYVQYQTFKELKDRFDALVKERVDKSYDGEKTNRSMIDEVGQWESCQKTNKEEYNFAGKKFFIIEDYTKYPMKDIPKNQLQAQIFIKEKKEADQKIKEAWNEFKNTKK